LTPTVQGKEARKESQQHSYEVTPLMIVNLSGVASVMDAVETLRTTIEHEPAAGTTEIDQAPPLVAEICSTRTKSVAAMNVLVNVNVDDA
jgi:hypothetical protein